MRAAALAFLGGILVVQQLPVLPSLEWGLLLIPLLILGWHQPRWLVLVFFVAGSTWVTYRADLVLNDRLNPEFEGQDMVVEGFLANIPQYAEHGVYFEFDILQAQIEGVTVPAPQRILLNIAKPMFDPRVGEKWRFTVRLKRPHGSQNPGGFDYEAFLFRNRIGAKGYVRLGDEIELLAPASNGYWIGRIRQNLGQRIKTALSDSPFAGIVVALANGDSRGINSSQWQILRRTGTLHLVAISGLHISLVAGLIFFLTRFTWSLPGTTVLRVPAPIIAAIFGILAATFYAALAGFVIPTQRALIMVVVALGAVILRQRFPPTQLLAVALLLVLLHDPLAVMASGFWLSFAAVAVIIYAVHGEKGKQTLWRKWGYIQWAIAVGLLPLMLWLFQQVSLGAPLANMLAVPMFDLFVVPLTLISALMLTVSNTLAVSMLQIAAGSLQLLWLPLSFLSEFEYGQWLQSRPPFWTTLCAVIGVVVLLAPRGWPARAVGTVWFLPMLLVRPPGPGPGEVWLTLLDVGQGLAAVVRTYEHSLLYDAGSRFGPRFDNGAAVVLPFLRAEGIERIDMFVVSHGDNDHIGGAASIMEGMPVTRVISSVPDQLRAGEPCHTGQSWRWDDIEFYVLNPVEGRHNPHNNASCVLLVRSPYGSFLLPGDIERAAEKDLIETAQPMLVADFLVAPHHGSRTSSTPEFIAAVQPRQVLFPIGYRNRYRHPHPLVTQRYADAKVEMYDSASAGAIEIRLTASGNTTTRYRDQYRRYWWIDIIPVSSAMTTP